MRKPKLTSQQRERLKILEPKLKNTIAERDYNSAKSLTVDIQNVLRPTGHYTRLAKSKNAFYELALETNHLDTAITGLISNRKIVSSTTRLYLEASALLAICYLRKKNLRKAKPLISEVLKNDSVIKTDRTRKKFRKEIIERFDEEIALYSLKEKIQEHFTEEELESEIIMLMRTNKSEDQLFKLIGQTVPQNTKFLLFEVHQFSTNQLPSAEKIALPSPDQKIKDKEIGKTVFQSVKRVIYNSLCDPNSDIYKAWFNDGMKIVLSKGYIRSTILASMASIGVGIKMIVAYAAALVMKLGLEVYCEHYKPQNLMNLRGQ